MLVSYFSSIPVGIYILVAVYLPCSALMAYFSSLLVVLIFGVILVSCLFFFARVRLFPLIYSLLMFIALERNKFTRILVTVLIKDILIV